MERIRRRFATTGLMVAASLKVHATVGVLSLPVRGARQVEELEMVGKVASWRTRAANSKSELVMCPEGFSKLMRSALISAGHCNRQT